MSGTLKAINLPAAEEVKALQAENAQLKASVFRLEQRVERLEKKLEEALETKPTSPEASLSSSQLSSSPAASLLHPSSPLLASPVSRSREVKAEVKEVEQLLQHVAYGEQEEAEHLIKRKPELLLCKGKVTDLSQREFKEITGFQYALWALDWQMWKMLLKYLPKEAAALQFAELEEKGTAYRKSFSLEPLIGALNIYERNYESWYQEQAWSKLDHHWEKVVGRNQLLLPVSVVNEYCHPDRSFYPVPSFEEVELKRSMHTNADVPTGGPWHDSIYNGGKLGEKFGYVRASNGRPACASGNLLSHTQGVSWTKIALKIDAEALQKLWEVRQEQLEALKAELAYFTAITCHLPPVLSEIVISYLAGDSATISVPGM